MGRDKKTIIKSPKLLILFTFFTTIIVMFFSLSKYKSTIAGDRTGRVAKYVLGIQTDSEMNIPINAVKPGSSQEFYFDITNEENNIKNEVTLKYTIELENKANLPLDFTLYKYDENISEYDEIKLNANCTDEFEINANVRINYKYKVKVRWKDNTESSSYKYNKTLDYLKVIVNAIQVD